MITDHTRARASAAEWMNRFAGGGGGDGGYGGSGGMGGGGGGVNGANGNGARSEGDGG